MSEARSGRPPPLPAEPRAEKGWKEHLRLGGLLLGAEAAAWLLADDAAEVNFVGFRLRDHLGLEGLALLFAAGILGFFAGPRLLPRWGPRAALLLGAAALALWLPFAGLSQAQPDAALYHILARQLAEEPGALFRWSELAFSKFQHPMPLGPALLAALYALSGTSPLAVRGFTGLVAVAAPLAIAAAAAKMQARTGKEPDHAPIAAGLLYASLPLVRGHSGWLLMDGLLVTTVALAWVWPAALLPAVLSKVSAPLFTVGPLLARLPRAAFAGVGAAALLGLLLVHPPFWRELSTYPPALVALGFHLRPGVLLLGLPVLRMADSEDRRIAGVIGALPVLLLYTPAEHLARYAMPVAAALCIAAGRASPRASGALIASGLVASFLGAWPVARHHQAENLRAAVAQAEAQGAQSIEVWSDMPATSFGTPTLAALIDLEARVPVRVGGQLGRAAPDRKRHWWEDLDFPEGLQATAPADAALLGLAGASPARFETEHPEWERAERVSLYRSSSLNLPREVVIYRRAR